MWLTCHVFSSSARLHSIRAIPVFDHKPSRRTSFAASDDGAVVMSGVGELAAHHLRRVLESVEEAEAPETTGRVLALCESARVSCLTGQAEVPSQIAGSVLT